MGTQNLEEKLDSTDREILKLLKDNSRAKWVEIAAAIGIAEATIRFRAKRLIDERIIKRFTIETNIEEPEAIVLIKIEPATAKKTLSEIKIITPEIFETSGEWDAGARIVSISTSELNITVDKIREIGGVIKTQTLIKLK